MKFPYLRFVKKFYFSKICEKMMFKIPICRNLNFCFQKNAISRYYRNYQHFFSNWHYAWGKMNFFWYFFIHFHNGWQVEISLFPTIFTIVQSDTPPSSCCWENVKKCQNFTYWFFDKNSKILHYTEKMIFSKFSKKTYIWWFWRKFPKICWMFRG